MNDLLKIVIDAHGGMARWRRINGIRVRGSITGAIWFAKGRGDVLKDVEFVVDTKRERVAMALPDKRMVFEPARVVVQNAQGEAIAERDNPVRAFDGQTQETPWEDIHVAYFCGEALWTYLNTPFLYAQAGFQTEEIASITVNGEIWRRLRVTFPVTVKSHTRTQISCFGPDGLLRRHDYAVDVLGGAQGLNYAYDYRNVDGIMIPTTRRVVGYEGDYKPIWNPVLVEISMREVDLV
jgi:hypothetical protein